MKIPQDTQTRVYEFTYLLPADLTDTELTKVRDAVNALLKKHGATVKDTQDWGKKELAYQIRHNGKRYNEAVYTHQVIEMMPDKMPAFDRDLRLDLDLMRQLIVIAEETGATQPAATPATEAEADSKEK